MRLVLICSAGSRLNREVLPAFFGSRFELVGMVLIEDRLRDTLSRVRHEWRRSGWRLLDVIAFRLVYPLLLGRGDRPDEFVDAMVASLGPARDMPVLRTTNINSPETVGFLESLEPDVAVAACKSILKPEVFDVPPHGTFVIHPGIVPEYRNTHGCFWALARRDLGRVGASLLRIDAGVDTGPVYGYYTAPYDEVRESHNVIQRRVVYANLEEITSDMKLAIEGTKQPIDTAGRASAAWGQPRLTVYLGWKRAARRDRQARRGK